ncbi:response regulator [Synechococcales cyanobacterium C]|uniref:Response regulator n=1 Tax=Petrachloros mirabilis ULC683 TaxID=2781853 RepID=A0A8K1ZZX5_9CYAN|nr:response regulator [Petrachloros mirabilis]NCJ07197.1 response regulator [Petrachloros mirabilis ULC683]
MRLLLVEADEALIGVVSKQLTQHCYVVDAVTDGEAALTYGSAFEYDLMMIAASLPKLDGISLCRHLRAEGDKTPILLLTANDTSVAKVAGLDAGADDCIAKPFDFTELIARVRALLRRSRAHASPMLARGALRLDPSTCTVTYNGQPLCLTSKEYGLLELFLQDAQHVYSISEILDSLWSSEEFPAEATVRSHLRRLRSKLCEVGAPSDLIATVHGRGYYLKIQADNLAVPDASPPELRFEMPPPHYANLLADAWKTYQSKCRDYLHSLTQASQELQSGYLKPPTLARARQATHALTTTMELFGLATEVRLARDLDERLQHGGPFIPEHVILFETLIERLRQWLDFSLPILPDFSISAVAESAWLPLLLIVDEDPDFTQVLSQAAKRHQFRTAVATTLETAKRWLTPNLNATYTRPDVVLLRLPIQAPDATGSKQPYPLLSHCQCLQELDQIDPDIPLVVLKSGGDSLTDDALSQAAGGIFLEASIPPDQIMATVTHLLAGERQGAKVMVVDSDSGWLRSLPTQLQPWGLQITTLDDPQQFWIVLQSVVPDFLVLNIILSEADGLDLCQALRSHPQWHRIPILLLSDIVQPELQIQAYQVGADDFQWKPVTEVELATRILNRLERLRAWVS